MASSQPQPSSSSSSSSAKEAFCDIVAGSVGGFMAKLLDYPLDTVKVLLQTTQQGSSTPKYKGAIDCLQQAIKEHGITSLYRGISSPLLGSMAENAVCFVAYANIKRFLLLQQQSHQYSNSNSTTTTQQQQQRDQLSLWELCIAGAGAGFAVSFVLTPIELVKCRLQVSAQQVQPIYTGPINVIVQTLKTEGFFHGLYKGHMSTMYREIPGNFCWFGTNELMCQLLSSSTFFNVSSRNELPMIAYMISGACAGVTYWTAFYPADTIKSLIQTHPEYSTLNFQQAFRKVYNTNNGIRALYRGWGITVLRAAPAHALIFAGYEQTLQLLKPKFGLENSNKESSGVGSSESSYHIYD